MPILNGIAELLQRFGAYGVASLAIVAMAYLFKISQRSADTLVAYLKEEIARRDANVLAERAATKAVQDSKDSLSERLVVAADRVITVQAALERHLSTQKPARVPREVPDANRG